MPKAELQSLLQLCRNTVRQHLLKLHANISLFTMVPELRLPSSLADYLLYNVAVNNNDDSDEDQGVFVDIPRRKIREVLVDTYPVERRGDELYWKRIETDGNGPSDNIVYRHL